MFSLFLSFDVIPDFFSEADFNLFFSWKTFYFFKDYFSLTSFFFDFSPFCLEEVFSFSEEAFFSFPSEDLPYFLSDLSFFLVTLSY